MWVGIPKQVLERLHQLEAKQALVDARVASVEDRMAELERRMALLEADHAKLRAEVAERLASLDAATTQRIEQAEASLAQARDDIAVNTDAVGSIASANRRTLH